MDEFIENFIEFRKFLNAESTDLLFGASIGPSGVAALRIVKERFEELGLNDVF